MTSEPRQMRYEIKMEASEQELPVVRSWTRLHSAGFATAYPPRWVNSVYFDTHSLDSLNDHLEGVPTRRKLRFRWYGEDLTSARGQIEVKNKTERAGWKLIQPVTQTLDLLGCSWSDLQESLAAEAQGVFRELLQSARPLVLVQYWREYYLSADGLIRLTLDSSIRTYDQWLSPRPNLTFRSPALHQLVIEFKCDVKDSKTLADVLAQFPLRTRRHSKFVSSLETLLER